MRVLQGTAHHALGLDLKPSPFTHVTGSITDRDLVRRSVHGVDAIVHTATLHKPHVATHDRQDFVDTNVTGTLNLLEEAVSSGVTCVVFTSTTSAFGRALIPPPDAPAAWVTEDVRPVPKNIYGVTKVAAEDLCELFHVTHRLPCIVLRTSRFFPESDDDPAVRAAYEDGNAKANEFLFRRVDLHDVVDAHLLAIEKGPSIGFARYIVSATTPFLPEDLPALRTAAPRVVALRVPAYADEYRRRGWTMFPSIERVYVNERARRDLGWQPRYNFERIVASLKNGETSGSELARVVGSKGYHDREFADGPYPLS